MTPTDASPAIVPNFDSEAGPGRKLAIICSKGEPRHGLPGADPGPTAALAKGVEVHMFCHFLGLSDRSTRRPWGT